MNEQPVAHVESFPLPHLPSLQELAQKFWKELLSGGTSTPNQEGPQTAVGDIIRGW
ncbi:MAG: hypothetical protein M3R24_40540 [Chloroflexota bacterium]|nr:hypothetical protein [Chloroflexota bacterium]